MKNTYLIFLKEVKAYFNSPIAYIVIIVFLLITGWLFASPLFLINQATMNHFIGNIPLLFTFFIPAITMRLFSEEMKSGTIEILMTLPFKDIEIVLGKYLSALFVLFVAIALTFVHPLSLSILGNVDWGQIIGCYIGMFIMGAGLAAISLFTSSITQNQVIAFILGFLFCFTFFMLGKILDFIPGRLSTVVEYISLDYHFNNLCKGVIDSRNIVYFMSQIILFISLTLSLIGMRKWS